MNSLKGKKTYILAAIVGVLAVLQSLGICDVPAEVWAFLGAGGMATLRSGVKEKP